MKLKGQSMSQQASTPKKGENPGSGELKNIVEFAGTEERRASKLNCADETMKEN